MLGETGVVGVKDLSDSNFLLGDASFLISFSPTSIFNFVAPKFDSVFPFVRDGLTLVNDLEDALDSDFIELKSLSKGRGEGFD